MEPLTTLSLKHLKIKAKNGKNITMVWVIKRYPTDLDALLLNSMLGNLF